MASSSSSSQLEYLNLTKFQRTALHLHNILNVENEYSEEVNYFRQIKTHLEVLESEYQSVLERVKQLESKTSTTATPSKRPFATLPDLCLIALFRELPLADQITAKHVNLRWHSLMQGVTQSRRRLILLVNHRRIDQLEDWINYPSYRYFNSQFQPVNVVSGKDKVLSLLRAEDGRPLYPIRRYTAWNTLQFGSLSREAVSLIVGTFPDVNELQLAINSAEVFNIEHLVSLLDHWQDQLTSLFLFNGLEDIHDDNDDIDATLLSAVNSLSALKCLTLYVSCSLDLDLPIIGQLKELNLRHRQSPSSSKISALLREHGNENRALARISLQCEVAVDMSLSHFTSLSPHLRDCFTQLHCNTWWSFLLAPDYFLHFRNITTLHLTYPDDARRIDLSMLTLLTQLIHLYLIIDFRSIRPEDPPYLLQRQVKSVRALELVLYLDTHEQLSPLNIAWLFPNVEAIHFAFNNTIFWSKCSHCNVEFFPDETRQQQSNLAQVKHCMRQLFAPFMRDCTKLRAIFHDRETVFGTANELLGQ